ncbi:hypothetical protein [Brevibacterium litoralis]|uniref:hypothetical protein n=1 Tax=Brevibacterium litoralis TaxID=3138935 RepID=UPI0032EFBE01
MLKAVSSSICAQSLALAGTVAISSEAHADTHTASGSIYCSSGSPYVYITTNGSTDVTFYKNGRYATTSYNGQFHTHWYHGESRVDWSVETAGDIATTSDNCSSEPVFIGN